MHTVAAIRLRSAGRLFAFAVLLLVAATAASPAFAQLTMAQQVPLAGAIIVSTPQDLALIDARKGLNMFRQVDVPVLGIVENMSYFLCSECGASSPIFGHGGAKAEAEKLGVTFLGEVPLHMDIREKSDSGQPPVVSDPDSAHAKVYREIAAKAWAELQRHHEAGAAQHGMLRRSLPFEGRAADRLLSRKGCGTRISGGTVPDLRARPPAPGVLRPRRRGTGWKPRSAWAAVRRSAAGVGERKDAAQRSAWRRARVSPRAPRLASAEHM